MTYEVTIAIPVYNAEKYIRKAMDSALAQTFSSIEFLVCDDCGTDKSINIIREYQQTHPRGLAIHIVHQPHNMGIGESRNRLVDEACGQYIYFMDADDYIEPDTIEKLYNNAIKYDLQLQKGLSELDKEEWVAFWRRYNLIQFFSGSLEDSQEEVDVVPMNREEVKALYPGMEDIVDILIDNNIPFSYDGVFELTDENNDVIASAAMIIDNPKIAIDPSSDADKAMFEQKGYKVIKQEDFNVELIK